MMPVISPVEAIPGFYISTGYSGHGFGVAPGAGRMLDVDVGIAGDMLAQKGREGIGIARITATRAGAEHQRDLLALVEIRNRIRSRRRCRKQAHKSADGRDCVQATHE